ncbi:MAG TPA: M23 family metallopeptidase [Nitrolancea sp.]|nr:M23 family metallopeptidase [Nitrolancea sp.]
MTRWLALGGLGCGAVFGLPLLGLTLLAALAGAVVPALPALALGGSQPGGNSGTYPGPSGAGPTIHNLGFGPSDAVRIDRLIAALAPDSPLRGYGATIVIFGQRFGIDPLLIVVWQLESQLDTVGLNVPGNGGNLIWEAMAPYAAAWGCTPGPASLGHQWGTCPSVTAGLGIWFQYVAQSPVYAMAADLVAFANRYNPCSDPANAANGFACGDAYAAQILALLRTAAGPTLAPTGYVFPVVGFTGSIDLHWGSYPGAADLFAPAGTPILAMRGGHVAYADYDTLGGWAVLIAGDDGLQYWYAHLASRPLVSAGQLVTAGTPLGVIGATGNADGGAPHLHLGIGPTILTGSGPTGGAGSDHFDAVSLLRQVYACCRR